jgi:hypothetical protein
VPPGGREGEKERLGWMVGEDCLQPSMPPSFRLRLEQEESLGAPRHPGGGRTHTSVWLPVSFFLDGQGLASGLCCCLTPRMLG